MRLKCHSQSIPPPVRLPGSYSLRWRQSDVEVWLAALPVRTFKCAPPRSRKGKHLANSRFVLGESDTARSRPGQPDVLAAGERRTCTNI